MLKLCLSLLTTVEFCTGLAVLGVRQRSPASSYWQGRAGHPRGLRSKLQRSNGTSLWPDPKPVHAEPSKLLSSSSIRAG